MNPLIYARLAQKAYSAAPLIGRQDSSARAIFEETADGIAFAFPGTNNVACFLADLDVLVESIQGLGGLHAGFWRSFLQIREPLWAQAQGSKLPVIACGHSEGAALALLFAGYLCLFDRPPKAVYAFEPPRVSIDGTLGALLAAHGVEVLITRKGEDIVPIVPRILHPWQHPAPVTAIGKAVLPIPNVHDHAIEGVIEALG